MSSWLRPVDTLTFLNYYSVKLAHTQVVLNCRYSVAKMCTCEDMLAHYLGAPYLVDVMSQNEHPKIVLFSFRQHTTLDFRPVCETH